MLFIIPFIFPLSLSSLQLSKRDKHISYTELWFWQDNDKESSLFPALALEDYKSYYLPSANTAHNLRQ